MEGFTLLELSVVIFIIALASAIVMPSLMSVMDVRIRKASRRMASTFRYLYGLSVTKKMTLRLYIDMEKGEYWATRKMEEETSAFVKEEGEEEESQYSKRRREREEKREMERKEREGEKIDEEEHKYEELIDNLAKRRKLPEGVSFEDVMLGEEIFKKGKVFISIYPDGSLDEAIIHLTNEDEDHYTLIPDTFTGIVDVEPFYYDPNEEKQE